MEPSLFWGVQETLFFCILFGVGKLIFNIFLADCVRFGGDLAAKPYTVL